MPSSIIVFAVAGTFAVLAWRAFLAMASPPSPPESFQGQPEIVGRIDDAMGGITDGRLQIVLVVSILNRSEKANVFERFSLTAKPLGGDVILGRPATLPPTQWRLTNARGEEYFIQASDALTRKAINPVGLFVQGYLLFEFAPSVVPILKTPGTVLELRFSDVAGREYIAKNEIGGEGAPGFSPVDFPGLSPQPRLAPQPAEPSPSAPSLLERSALSWGVGVEEDALLLSPDTLLPLTVGHRQVFTPAVLAPKGISITNVRLEICLPLEFVVEPAKGWTFEGRTECARYSVVLGPIDQGQWIAAQKAMAFRSPAAGLFAITFAISTEELPMETGYFRIGAIALPKT